MKRALLASFLFILLCVQALASEEEWTYSGSKILNIKRIQKERELALADDSLISEIDSETGAPNAAWYTARDAGVMTLGGYANFKPSQAMNLKSFDLGAGWNVSSVWVLGFINMTSGTFDVLSENPTSGTLDNPDAEYLNPRPDDILESLTTFGGGIGYRTRFHLIPSDNLFQTCGAYLTWTILNDAYRSLSYSGAGIRADYGIHYRMGSKLHVGMRFMYNISQVKRAPLVELEEASDRSLLLAWPAIGLDVGFYF